MKLKLLSGLLAATLLYASGDGLTDLHRAAADDDLTKVRALVKAGADVNAVTREGGITPLFLAAATGDGELLEELLKAGADLRAVTTDGATPLMAAAASGGAGAITALLNHGADVNAKETARGETALMFAAGKNRAAAVRLLIAHGADAAVTTRVVPLGKATLDEDGNPIAARGGGKGGGGAAGGGRGGGVGGQARGASATVTGGMTALIIAARDGHLEALKALLESGADVNQVSAGDKTSALVIGICNGHYDEAEYLLEHGADPNRATIDGLAALYAVEDTEYAQVGWAPNPITTQEKTPYLELLKALLAHHADPSTQLSKALWFRPTSHNQEWVDKKGATPFWRAAMATDVPAMKILLAAGADPAINSAEGVTPLMVAAGLGWGANASRTVPDGWLPAVQYLVTELHADVNAQDAYNYTALHGAAYRGDNEVAKFLVEHGAKLDVRSKKGQTVTDMANGPMVNAHLPMEHPDTIALLRKLGAPDPQVATAGAPRQTPQISK